MSDANPEDVILRTEGLTKRFGGFTAVDNLNLRIRRGSIHALIGPNGAGKTTAFNLLTKFLAPSEGRIYFNDRDITQLTPTRVARLGVGRSFQISAVFTHMTVLENLQIALQRRLETAYAFWKAGKVLNQLNARARDLLAEVGLQDYASWQAGELPYGRKRALEVATTLALDPELLLLDEPTAGMAVGDIDGIVRLIQTVAQTRTVLMVEHNLSIVSSICQTISVLQHGVVVAEGDYQTVSKDPGVIAAYIGGAPHV